MVHSSAIGNSKKLPLDRNVLSSFLMSSELFYDINFFFERNGYVILSKRSAVSGGSGMKSTLLHGVL